MKDFKVIRTWRHTPKSKTILFTLPLDIAGDYNLLEPANVMVIRTESGILLRKLEVPK